MQNKFFIKNILVVCVITLFASCDKDFNEIGSNIIGEDHYGLLRDDTKTVIAYNQSLGPIESNNLPINPLGVYNNSVFGTTKANYATQLEFLNTDVNPTINPALSPAIESVVLTIPYFSNKIKTNEDGSGEYELDSIFGTLNSKIKLSVYESGYFIKDFDPTTGFQERQAYYTNQNADFDNAKGTLLNTDIAITENDAFVFSPLEHVEVTTVDGVEKTTRTAPGMRLNLNKTFFKTKIIEAPAGKLINNNVFKEYFRGLYFKVDYSGSEPGSMASINFRQGKITVKYKENLSLTDSDPAKRVEKTITLNLTGNSVSLHENSNINPVYATALLGANADLGDEKLYVKGGEGSVTVIDLFGKQDIRGYNANGVLINSPNGVADELDDLRNPVDGKKLLINEANLTFYIDNTTMTNTAEPNRVYLYDLNNNRPLLDYFFDTSTSLNPKLNKFVHGGIIEKETVGINKRGIKYKIRITNHLRSLIKFSDSTNVKLGLVVTENIATTSSAKIKNPFIVRQIPAANGASKDFTVKRAPLSALMNALGTVLLGNNIPASNPDYDKRLKLEIYYTKPN